MKMVKPSRKATLVSKLLRAVGKDDAFETPLSSPKERHVGTSIYYPDLHRELRNAALEAENHKAMAMLDYRRHDMPR